MAHQKYQRLMTEKRISRSMISLLFGWSLLFNEYSDVGTQHTVPLRQHFSGAIHLQHHSTRCICSTIWVIFKHMWKKTNWLEQLALEWYWYWVTGYWAIFTDNGIALLLVDTDQTAVSTIHMINICGAPVVSRWLQGVRKVQAIYHHRVLRLRYMLYIFHFKQIHCYATR